MIKPDGVQRGLVDGRVYCTVGLTVLEWGFALLHRQAARGALTADGWGPPTPGHSKPGTIRGDFCIQVGRNVMHGSDSVESANKEIALWFKDEELVSWQPADKVWVYED
ncbi:nucleoside diphosphate kinase-like [Daphnia pulicaria]|uniref:nucleoside diphosphate kinase-like n=1 Tax=Daphnia pulicaria TaxID=35523 RepID=UPI001EEC8F3C|nr:nucleoside diphosphate kinase-like [Daphnia pulicaria]